PALLKRRPVGSLSVVLAFQLSVPGVNRPPVFTLAMCASNPPPDDHFTAGPHCRVKVSGFGRVGGAGGRPTVRAGIVSPTGVEKVQASNSAPDDHFTAGPHCRVTVSGRGRGSECRWSPSVIGAATRGTSYYRKRVICAANCRHRHWHLRAVSFAVATCLWHVSPDAPQGRGYNS